MDNNKWKDKYLRKEDIKSEWFKSLPENDAMIACDFMNFSFYTDDVIIKSINNCTDYSWRQKMMKRFNKSVKSGWGVGVQDMEDAVRHLSENNYVWTDENHRKYWPLTGNPRLYKDGCGFTAAEACVNFIKAVEDELFSLKSIARDFKKLNDKLRIAKNKPDNWSEIGSLLSQIKDNADRIQPLLWSSPRINSVSIKVNSYADLLGKIHTAATRVVKLQTLDLSALQITGVVVGVTVLDFVPVLGGLYSAAVDWAIDVLPRFQELIRNRMQFALSCSEF